jgi:hypothetical protein
MEQWEYLPTFLEANAKSKDKREYLKKRMPDVKKPPRYTPEAMMPELNRLGEEGWELIHMEPVSAVGRKGDVLFDNGRQWSNVYFCVFKRRKAGAVPVAANGMFSGTAPAQSVPTEPLPPDPLEPSAD